ncbi:LOW QUALITY PROTEIN: hypothetical protein Cgig2_013326 [Carnegiea gigantea]|uniref:Reverse transcriptase domain-containing protein n=1 Tax=Carnegiea gigantea TaxID=171969 RepID=A0A9Q1GTH5_9CARY|nr:LOW QUALITY PROTEIN: hypothetical protein Cgig2_013326 [Carnegiea gigantea]
MFTTADAIMRQVFEQVKRAMKVAGSAKPVHEGEPSHRLKGMPSLRPMEHRAIGFLPGGKGGVRRWNLLADIRKGQLRGHPTLHRLPPMTAPPRPQNARKYCEFHEQSGHTTTECRELKKALHELADKGKIDRFLKRGPQFLRQGQTPAPPHRGMRNIPLKSWPPQREVNLTGMIHLPVRFGDKNKSKSLEVNFLVVDMPMAYNVIIECPTLHRVKAVVAPENKHKQNRGTRTTRRVLHRPRALPPRTHWPQLLRDWWPRPQQPHPQTKEG